MFHSNNLLIIIQANSQKPNNTIITSGQIKFCETQSFINLHRNSTKFFVLVRRVFETNVRLDSSNYSKLAYSPKLFISNPPNLKFCVNYRNKGLSFQHIQVRIIPFENIVCIITIFPLKVYDTKGISLTSYHKNVNFVF